MAILGRGYTFGATEEVTASKLHALVDGGSATGFSTSDISDGAITDAKITSVGGNKITGLSGIPSGSGLIPAANIPVLAAANIDVGTTANKIVQLNASAQLPAISGALLTNLPNQWLNIIQNVTSDPGSPSSGQIWYRTNL